MDDEIVFKEFNKRMLIGTAILRAIEGKEDELEKEFCKLISSVRKEPGTLTYVVHRALDDPQKFFVYEKYQDREALNYHAPTPHLKKFFNTVSGMLEGKAEISFFREIV